MRHAVVLLLGLMMTVPVWANEPPASSTSESSKSSDDGHLYVKDLPKPILDTLAEIQRLSAKVEPEIEKFGSRFRQEVDQAVKRLREAVKDQRSSDKKETP